jgi:diadenosine tetraphosphate (Ap4A) HIT family hydrolase
MSADECAICKVAAATPEDQLVLRTAHFAVDTGMEVPGWLLLWTVRHEAQGLWSLTDEETAELGPLLRDLAGALGREHGAERTYVMSMGEHALHFHAMVMARPAGAPADQRGPGLLAAGGALADPDAARALAARLRGVLAARDVSG